MLSQVLNALVFAAILGMDAFDDAASVLDNFFGTQ